MTDYFDLSGTWECRLGEAQPAKLPRIVSFDALKGEKYSIALPGTTSAAGLGKPNEKRERGFLTDAFAFEGCLWLNKQIDLSGLAGKKLFLFLERTRRTTLYIDGKRLGDRDILVAPHIYELPAGLSEGLHTVTICVQNYGYKTAGGHLTSKDTQSNWCGITGRIELRICERQHIHSIRVRQLYAEKALHITGEMTSRSRTDIICSAESFNTYETHIVPECLFRSEHGRFDLVYPLGDDALEWSPERPALYKFELRTDTDFYSCTVGLRDFKAQGNSFRLNGRSIFLRGKHDGLVFPKTGYAPTDLDSWLDVMGTARDWGINHYRFHTCCPPEAAFEAADRLGIIMEPQLPFWGTVKEPGEEGYNKQEQDFLFGEGMEMLRCFGSHPSFCMMSLGNELWGSQKELDRMLGEYKAFDPDKLYTQGSNNFQFFPAVLPEDDFFVGVRLAKDRLIRGSYAMCDAPLGHIQTDKPSTLHDYDAAISGTASAGVSSDGSGTVQIQYGTGVKTVEASAADGAFVPNVPVISHEIGQFETFPNFAEIDKYTGPLKPRNLELFREDMDKAGLLPLAEDLFTCSGKLAAQCYKEELEAALRSKKLSGFQLLDLQDFPGQGTALVGMLDAFMDSKGLISKEEWKGFCSDTVLLARFGDYCLEAGQPFKADIELADFSEKKHKGSIAKWSLKGESLDISGEAEIISDEEHCLLCKIDLTLPETDKPETLTLTLFIEGTDIRNSYSLMLYPKRQAPKLKAFKKLCPEAEELLAQGKTVLITPGLSELENSIEGFYCTDFWCYPMFRSISESMGKPVPVGTMGLMIDSEHPLFRDFPTEKWSTPRWYEIVSNSRSEILDGNSQEKKVIVRTIDNFERCHDLALMYEFERNGGKAVVLNCDLAALEQSPEGRQFLFALKNYIGQ